MPLFLEVILGKLTRIISYDPLIFPVILRTVKPDDLDNTAGILESKHIAHLFLVVSAMHLSGNILSNSATPFSIFPCGIEANARSASDMATSSELYSESFVVVFPILLVQ